MSTFLICLSLVFFAVVVLYWLNRSAKKRRATQLRNEYISSLKSSSLGSSSKPYRSSVGSDSDSASYPRVTDFLIMPSQSFGNNEPSPSHSSGHTHSTDYSGSGGSFSGGGASDSWSSSSDSSSSSSDSGSSSYSGD